MKTFLILAMLAAIPANATMYITDYKSIPFNSDHTRFGSGVSGEYLDHLVVNVTTSASSSVAITDGASTVADDLVLVPASTPVGTYYIQVGARSRVGGWRITTRAGASVLAVGAFK